MERSPQLAHPPDVRVGQTDSLPDSQACTTLCYLNIEWLQAKRNGHEINTSHYLQAPPQVAPLVRLPGGCARVTSDGQPPVSETAYGGR